MGRPLSPTWRAGSPLGSPRGPEKGYQLQNTTRAQLRHPPVPGSLCLLRLRIQPHLSEALGVRLETRVRTRARLIRPGHGSGKKRKDHLGMGQNQTTRNWTAGFSPWFHLPGFHLGYLLLTHSHFKSWEGDLGNRCLIPGFCCDFGISMGVLCALHIRQIGLCWDCKVLVTHHCFQTQKLKAICPNGCQPFRATCLGNHTGCCQAPSWRSKGSKSRNLECRQYSHSSHHGLQPSHHLQITSSFHAYAKSAMQRFRLNGQAVISRDP